ncbi:corticoliberin [Alligator mississippiensis]|uniref:corticoliberin n=1 Tax=Alligator mississippiensis TaxID=8496 RepID=UPI002877978D|nr:corticoliberin [Alligator mississippiensis]
MRIPLLVSTGILLLALLPCRDGRALSRARPQQELLPPPPPPPLGPGPAALLRLAEEYVLRLGSPGRGPASPAPPAAAGPWLRAPAPRPQALPERGAAREKRSDEPPISLDLTFHLLREVLEMARAEQLAQQAHSNRKLMEIIGK